MKFIAFQGVRWHFQSFWHFDGRNLASEWWAHAIGRPQNTLFTFHSALCGLFSAVIFKMTVQSAKWKAHFPVQSWFSCPSHANVDFYVFCTTRRNLRLHTWYWLFERHSGEQKGKCKVKGVFSRTSWNLCTLHLLKFRAKSPRKVQSAKWKVCFADALLRGAVLPAKVVSSFTSDAQLRQKAAPPIMNFFNNASLLLMLRHMNRDRQIQA